MKLKIGAFEVDIKAKHEFSSKFNKGDTEYFLNVLCVAFGNAGFYDKMQGNKFSEQANEEMWKDIHEFLLNQEGASDI